MSELIKFEVKWINYSDIAVLILVWDILLIEIFWGYALGVGSSSSLYPYLYAYIS